MTYTKADLTTIPAFDLTKFEIGKAYQITMTLTTWTGVLFEKNDRVLNFMICDEKGQLSRRSICADQLQDGDSITEMVAEQES